NALTCGELAAKQLRLLTDAAKARDEQQRYARECGRLLHAAPRLGRGRRELLQLTHDVDLDVDERGGLGVRGTARVRSVIARYAEIREQRGVAHAALVACLPLKSRAVYYRRHAANI